MLRNDSRGRHYNNTRLNRPLPAAYLTTPTAAMQPLRRRIINHLKKRKKRERKNNKKKLKCNSTRCTFVAAFSGITNSFSSECCIQSYTYIHYKREGQWIAVYIIMESLTVFVDEDTMDDGVATQSPRTGSEWMDLNWSSSLLSPSGETT